MIKIFLSIYGDFGKPDCFNDIKPIANDIETLEKLMQYEKKID